MDKKQHLEPDELQDAISMFPQNAHWLPTVEDLLYKYKIEEDSSQYIKFLQWVLASIPNKTANEELQVKLFLIKFLNRHNTP